MAGLPDELLQQIFSYLHLSQELYVHDEYALNSQTLRNLALASKRFNNLARTALYHTVTFRWDNRGSVGLLLRTICENRAMSDLVMDLNLYGWDTEFDVGLNRADLRPPSSDLALLYDQVITSLNLPQDLTVRIQRWLSQGLEDAQMAALIVLCRRLHRLRVQLPYLNKEGSCIMIDAFRAAAYSRPDQDGDEAPYDRLREVHIAHWDTEYTTSISECRAFLGLPSLHTLVLEQIDECGNQLGDFRCTAEKVVFENSIVDAEGLEDLLKACPDIKALSIGWGGALYGDVIINFAEVGAALRQRGSGLRVLKLDSEDALGCHDDSEGYLGSLTALTALEHLTVSIRALYVRYTWESQPNPDHHTPEVADDAFWLVNTLPTSLKTLEILDVYEDRNMSLHDAQIFELMQHPSFRDLQTVILSTRKEPLSQALDQSGWRVSCAPANISCNGKPYTIYTLLRRGSDSAS